MTTSTITLRHMRRLILTTAVTLSLVCATDAAFGQRRKKVKIPPVQRISVNTRDGVVIRCNYYPGGVIERKSEKKKGEMETTTRSGKEVVPIIMLHAWEGRRGEYDFLASFLQRKGHAVVVPDLRGHGDSTTLRGGTEIKRTRPSVLIKGMVFDVDAVKKFLLAENNEAKLNIELLCVVGAESGAIVAVDWAQHDWSWRQLPTFKQGRDVKALVLLSPEQSFKGVTLNQSIQHPAVRSMAMMLISGRRDRSRYSDAKSIFNRLERFHQDATDVAKKDLYFLQPDVSLHGTRLVDRRVQSPELPIARNIEVFIQRRLINRQDVFQWHERKSPLATSG